MAKKISAREVMLAYPDFNKPFKIHTDASHYQLGAVISPNGKPIAFYSQKLNPAQTWYIKKMSGFFFFVDMTEKHHTMRGYQCFFSSPDVFIPAKTFPPDVYFWQTHNIQLGCTTRHSLLRDIQCTED
jgi:RNase H-like domain found in reverse transcriptase